MNLARRVDPQHGRAQREHADDDPDEERETAAEYRERRPGVGEPGQEGQDEDPAGEQRACDVGVLVGDDAGVAAASPGDGMRQSEGGTGHRRDQRQRLPSGWQQRHPQRSGRPGDHFQAAARAPQGEAGDDPGGQGAGSRPRLALFHADG